MVTRSSEFRAAILRVLHKYTAGVPRLSMEEAAAMGARRAGRDEFRLCGRLAAEDMPLLETFIEIAAAKRLKTDFRFAQHAEPEDFALLNACLEAEHELVEREFDALEALLAETQWSDGDLDERVLALPGRAFARAAERLYDLGWVD